MPHLVLPTPLQSMVSDMAVAAAALPSGADWSTTLAEHAAELSARLVSKYEQRAKALLEQERLEQVGGELLAGLVSKYGQHCWSNSG